MKNGFTMVEMLVVMGIIAVLSGSMIFAFGRVTRASQRARAQETVSNAATALAAILQKSGSWPVAIVTEAKGEGRMKWEVAQALAKRKVMSVSVKNTNTYEPVGTDRCGIVTPWASAVLKRASSTAKNDGLNLAVPSGGTVQDHILYYAIDLDGDGVTEATVNGQMVRIRALSAVWCAGADGKLADYAQMGRSDDIYSWQKAQEDKQ